MERVLALNLQSTSPTFATFATFGDLVNVIVRNAYVLAGVISFLLLVFGGFSIIMGAGSSDTKQIEKGKQAMTGAVIGLIIVVTSFWIVQIIEKVTGVPLLTPP
ncbi:hypothetical protein A2973_02690 [Candidatus Gottesmanbacteria bacterium RIFCSPLOWO2_01_FULL_49_10]|uniref:Uncharacterized protein n=1 Tax=Candidatus Gottesmanbacteria bacterium RIFCSPLOWO2_01_FULL_49_10 TaxID=1798396 RepID=A0A1F6B1K8_9BACT|nr:MAG: hypothetical protein UY10_C0004G0028 [Microgenomates group bacterium GW2011_GWA2_47_8]OGG30806.1 MAG: hypothetical protein A2973_02690 [Candidatus Gottesmanbacteria bacterium RIFCSPLOWO2_01_FULL_49_10]